VVLVAQVTSASGSDKSNAGVPPPGFVTGFASLVNVGDFKSFLHPIKAIVNRPATSKPINGNLNFFIFFV
jgi:hypothetical protein